MTWRQYWQTQTFILAFFGLIYVVTYFAQASANEPPPLPISPIRVPSAWQDPDRFVARFPARQVGALCHYVLSDTLVAIGASACP